MQLDCWYAIFLTKNWLTLVFFFLSPLKSSNAVIFILLLNFWDFPCYLWHQAGSLLNNFIIWNRFRAENSKGLYILQKNSMIYIVAFFHSYSLFTFWRFQCNFSRCLHNVRNIFNSKIVASSQFLFMKILKSDQSY